jgi:hypothetical protein
MRRGVAAVLMLGLATIGASAQEFTARQRQLIRAATLMFYSELIQCAWSENLNVEARTFCDRLKWAPDARIIELLDCGDRDLRCQNPLPPL